MALWLPDRDPVFSSSFVDFADRPGCQVPAVTGSMLRPEVSEAGPHPDCMWRGGRDGRGGEAVGGRGPGR